MAYKYNPIRYETDAGYRARIDAARKGGRSRSRAKVTAVRANLERAREARLGIVRPAPVDYGVPDPESRNAEGLTPREAFVKWACTDLPRLQAERRAQSRAAAADGFAIE